MFTHVNLKMKDKYGMTEDAIIEKGLATTAEIKKLKGKADLNVGRSNFTSFEEDLLSQSKSTWLDHWFVPLNWCCHMIKDELNKGGHIPRYFHIVNFKIVHTNLTHKLLNFGTNSNHIREVLNPYFYPTVLSNFFILFFSLNTIYKVAFFTWAVPLNNKQK